MNLNAGPLRRALLGAIASLGADPTRFGIGARVQAELGRAGRRAVARTIGADGQRSLRIVGSRGEAVLREHRGLLAGTGILRSAGSWLGGIALTGRAKEAEQTAEGHHMPNAHEIILVLGMR
jgi:hypothetical protein